MHDEANHMTKSLLVLQIQLNSFDLITPCLIDPMVRAYLRRIHLALRAANHKSSDGPRRLLACSSSPSGSASTSSPEPDADSGCLFFLNNDSHFIVVTKRGKAVDPEL